jgi:hypothetical protein
MKHTLTALVLALTMTTARAADYPRAHAGVAHRVVTIDDYLIHPSAVTMSADDVLEFVNYSSVRMILVFLEPEGHSNKPRCHVTSLHAGRGNAPEALRWDSPHQPAEIIPPGKFVSVCSLAPGKYSFVTKRVDSDESGPLEQLGTKGTISVE